jgi:phosphatidylserine/phosphatidylglycerophosphate/cardiolipin synthase-like enzyme
MLDRHCGGLFHSRSTHDSGIGRACERGVRIRVLLPGKHIDSQTARIASKRGWGPLLRSGAEIHVYQPTMLHCKMLIFDDYMVSVGSTNFDMRSFELNDEASLNVYDSRFAGQMRNVFERDLKSATRYTYEHWRRRGLAGEGSGDRSHSHQITALNKPEIDTATLSVPPDTQLNGPPVDLAPWLRWVGHGGTLRRASYTC